MKQRTAYLSTALSMALVLLVVVSGCAAPASAPGATSAPAPTKPAQVATQSTPTVSSEPTAIAAPKTIRVGTSRDILTLDPALMVQLPDYPIATAIYSSLVKYKPGMTTEVEGDLAEKWETSPDGKTYTFHLRKGVKWQGNYGEVTADDVKYTFERIRDQKTASPYASDFANVEAMEVKDEYTFSITFKTPNVAFIRAVAAFRPGRIVKKEAIEKFGKEYTANAVGSGPYVLEKWTPNSEIVLAKNPEYWNAAKYTIDRIVYKVIPEASVRALALQSGDIDIAYVSDPESLSALQGAKDVSLMEAPGTNIVKLYFQCQRAPFNDPRVRRAISYAIDADSIGAFALDGVGAPARSEIPPFMFGYTENVEKLEFNVEKAKQLLADAGVTTPLDMNIIVWDFGTYPKASEPLPAMLREIGINVKLEIVEGGLIQTRFKQGNYDGAVFGIGRFDADQVLTPGYLSANVGSSNRAYYSNPELDKVIAEQASAVDPAKRAAALERAQQMIRKDTVDVPLYVEKIFLAARSNVKGALPAPMDVYSWDLLTLE